jgi:hypothetical protein
MSQEVQTALEALPSRPLTDTLVDNFMANFNYRHFAVYPPQFKEEYQKWWKDVDEKKPLCVDFSGLVLRVCASSSQYLGPELHRQLRGELSVPPLVLSQCLNDAADNLSKCRPDGYGNLTRMQELFHAACWLKSDGQISKVWRVLCNLVHEAKAIGMCFHFVCFFWYNGAASKMWSSEKCGRQKNVVLMDLSSRLAQGDSDNLAKRGGPRNRQKTLVYHVHLGLVSMQKLPEKNDVSFS